MAKFKVILERVETITKQGTVLVEADSAWWGPASRLCELRALRRRQSTPLRANSG
jgi:hypothetical protein